MIKLDIQNICLTFLSVITFFCSYFSNYTYLFLVLIVTVVLFNYLSKRLNIQEVYLYLICFFAPTSFISIIGTSFGELPITWFHIFSLLLISSVFCKKKVSNEFLIYPLLLFTVFLITFLRVANYSNALNQLLTIILFVLQIIAIINIKYENKNTLFKYIEKCYITNTIIFSIVIIFQRLLYTVKNISIGYTIEYPGRILFGGYFSDYSFASLFIASGALIIILKMFETKKNTFIYTLLQFVFVGGMLSVNSRTGLYVYICTLILFILKRIQKREKTTIYILFILVFSLPLIFYVVMNLRGNQMLFDDSNRGVGYISAIKIFLQFPIFGFGLGIENLFISYNTLVPHNFFFQYLCQIGLVGTGILSVMFMKLWNRYNVRGSIYNWVLLEMFLGSMFIPDILSSRFLMCLIAIFVLYNKKTRGEKYEKKSI